MNNEMATLLGMIVGNGEINRLQAETTITIKIPHKSLKTDFDEDVQIYVKASITDLKNILDPLIGTNINVNQQQKYTYLSFTKPNEDFLIREIRRLIGDGIVHKSMNIPPSIFSASNDIKKSFLRGLSDVTGYIRKSNNAYGKDYNPRVYIEIPYNWELVVEIANLLKSVDVPVESIDWAHPNTRDANLRKYNEGNINFWKKEHQIKIWAVEFLPIGFSIIHKTRALGIYADIQKGCLVSRGEKECDFSTHKFYWAKKSKNRKKLGHPGENDNFIPEKIRGKHYNSWKEIANDLGYLK